MLQYHRFTAPVTVYEITVNSGKVDIIAVKCQAIVCPIKNQWGHWVFLLKNQCTFRRHLEDILNWV